MESKKSILIWLSVMCCSLLISCGKQELGTSDESSSSSGGATVTISTAWETDQSTYVAQKSCSLSGTASSPQTATCTATIPETRLFYSYLKFEITHEGSTCELVRFAPYAFRKSTSALYTPVGATATVDCSDPTDSGDPDECWGGAATSVVTTGYYDTYTHVYTTGTDDLEIELDPPNTKTGADRSLRYTVNDLPSAQQTVDVAPGGANGSGTTITEGFEYDAAAVTYYNYYQDYKVMCVDEYGNTTATITIIIDDDNGTSPSTDDIDSWL